MCDQVFPDGEIDEDGFDEEGNRWETDEDYKCNYKMLPVETAQQPLFECANCYEHVTHHADHLRVHNGECWCEGCWDEMAHEIDDGRDWDELEPFKPMLNTEYEKLQTEYEQLVSYTKNGIECFAKPCPEHSGVNTPPFSEFRERYGQLCLMCVVDERDTLRAECEKLRKDAARYQSLLEAVLHEIPHRKWRRGNAPGHAHSVPGIWDEDNGALAGKECAWCKVWNEAVSAMQQPAPPLLLTASKERNL